MNVQPPDVPGLTSWEPPLTLIPQALTCPAFVFASGQSRAVPNALLQKVSVSRHVRDRLAATPEAAMCGSVQVYVCTREPGSGIDDSDGILEYAQETHLSYFVEGAERFRCFPRAVNRRATSPFYKASSDQQLHPRVRRSNSAIWVF